MDLDGKAVLAATDLSARSDRAVDRACLLAHEWGVRLVLVHAVEPGSTLEIKPDGAQRVVRSVLPDPSAEAEIFLPHGPAPQAIVETAQRAGCGIIVTGVARYNHLGDYILGTAVDHVIRHAAQPVLVVKQRPRGPYRSILVATDLSDCSRQALLSAADMFPDATLHLIHAYHVPFEGWLDFEGSREEMRQLAQKELDAFLEKANLAESVRERLFSLPIYGSSGTAVQQAVEEIEPNLIVLGTHGWGVTRNLIGSTASSLLKSIPVDTLMIRDI